MWRSTPVTFYVAWEFFRGDNLPTKRIEYRQDQTAGGASFQPKVNRRIVTPSVNFPLTSGLLQVVFRKQRFPYIGDLTRSR